MNKWEDTYPVSVDGTDRLGRATMPWICRQLQQTATHHAESLGVGYHASQAKRKLWVLSRLWVRMNRMPRFGEEVTVATWPSGQTKLTWDRDFRLTGSDGEELGVASTLWLYIDQDTRRPRPAREGLELDVTGAERVRPEGFRSLPAADGLRPAQPFQVGFYSIDVHGHVNNVSYITWVLESLSNEWLGNRSLKELEINFLAEGFAGDTLIPQLAESSDGIIDHAVTRSSDSKVLCRARTRWQPREPDATDGNRDDNRVASGETNAAASELTSSRA
jgi:acyl-ACP thioesterase